MAEYYFMGEVDGAGHEWHTESPDMCTRCGLQRAFKRIMGSGQPEYEYFTFAEVVVPPVQARCATIANINLASTITSLDGVDLSGSNNTGLAGSDIVLVKNQTTASENGLYWANTGGAMVRCAEPLVPSRAVAIPLTYCRQTRDSRMSVWELVADDWIP